MTTPDIDDRFLFKLPADVNGECASKCFRMLSLTVNISGISDFLCRLAHKMIVIIAGKPNVIR